MTESIVKNLEAARRLAFDDFDKIVLQPEAVEVLINLFLHPGCKSDMNLAKFLTGQTVPLTEISPHIITAFPSQVATYAKNNNKLRIKGVDLLECFALDHADAVEENYQFLKFTPSYALAHVLTIGTTTNVRNIENRQLVDVDVTVCDEPVKFSNVLVPGNMKVKEKQMVFHHFGVVVAKVTDKALKIFANKLQKTQDRKSFIQKTVKQVLGKEIESIDYAKASFFKVDMTGQIIDQSKKDMDFFRLWQAEDLKKVRIPKVEKKNKEEVMFQS